MSTLTDDLDEVVFKGICSTRVRDGLPA